MRQSSIFKHLLILAVLCSVGLCRPSDDGKAQNDEPDYPGDGNEDLEDLEETDDESAAGGPTPLLKTQDQVISVEEGSPVTLPCEVENAESYVRTWRNKSNIIYQDTLPLTTDKNRVILNPKTFALTIYNVTKYDTGVYACSILTSTAGPVVMHTLHVKDKSQSAASPDNHIKKPAKIDVFEPKGPKKIIEKGKSLSLVCHANGYPQPNVFWTRKLKGSTTVERLEGTNHTIPSVSREHTGVYECIAKNQNHVDKQSVEIHVHYEPEVSIKSDTVNTAEGKVSEMHCTVYAEPAATLVWLKDDKQLKSNEHISLFQDPNKVHKHILKIEKTKPEDFGPYYCIANNSLGTTRKSIVLSGTPLRPIFERASVAGDSKSPRLVWTVESLSEITSYELQYRKQEADSDAWEVAHPKVLKSSDSVHYSVVHDLHGLESGTYEAVLRAENAYGWSYPSPPNIFSGEDNMSNEIIQGPLEPNPNHASQLSISFALVLSIVIARVYC
uniref:Opioid-binding protein/cell adhesion molecule homolog n=1 Tax=Cacopsylla melanoneura TaxID=428564 RepID=A0A8D8LXL5_9HEMI